MAAEHDNHGQTPAAWTAVIIIMLAFVVGTAGLILGQTWMFWAGVALVVVGGIVGKVMQMMGLGAHHEEADREAAAKVESAVSK